MSGGEYFRAIYCTDYESIARELKVSVGTVKSLCRSNRNCYHSAYLVLCLADYFGVSVEALLRNDYPEEN